MSESMSVRISVRMSKSMSENQCGKSVTRDTQGLPYVCI